MTAADAREQLEAAVHRNWPAHPGDFSAEYRKRVEAILAAADAYAMALTEQEMDRYDGRQRLAAATAEYFGERP